MKEVHGAKELADGLIEPKHEVEKVCASCGHDLDAAEIQNTVCHQCGAPMALKQSTKIFITTLPGAEGDTLL